MGLAIAVAFNPDKYEGKLDMPRRSLQPFPQSQCCAPGHLATYLHALPPSHKQPMVESADTFWWVDCQFMPHQDNKLCCSVGLYKNRGRGAPLSVSPFTKGLLYTITLSNKLSYHIIKGSRSTAMPKITPLPDGDHICYIGIDCIKITNLSNKNTLTKNKDYRNNSFRYTAICPSGIYLAAISRFGTSFELSILLIDPIALITMETYECHRICPGFRGTQSYSEEVECKFSPDGKMVAVSSSMGLFFVIQRKKKSENINVVGKTGTGMFDVNEIKLNTVRAYDFDPRYLHRILTFASSRNRIFVCDILNGKVENEIEMGLEEVVCLKYSTHVMALLAAATQEGKIHFFHPNSSDRLYAIDLTLQASQAPLNPLQAVMIRLSFSTSGQHLAVSATDGLVRIWQIQTDLSLQSLSRNALLRYVKCSDIHKLPLPPKLILYLLQWPCYE